MIPLWIDIRLHILDISMATGLVTESALKNMNVFGSRDSACNFWNSVKFQGTYEKYRNI